MSVCLFGVRCLTPFSYFDQWSVDVVGSTQDLELTNVTGKKKKKFLNTYALIYRHVVVITTLRNRLTIHTFDFSFASQLRQHPLLPSHLSPKPSGDWTIFIIEVLVRRHTRTDSMGLRNL